MFGHPCILLATISTYYIIFLEKPVSVPVVQFRIMTHMQEVFHKVGLY